MLASATAGRVLVCCFLAPICQESVNDRNPDLYVRKWRRKWRWICGRLELSCDLSEDGG